MYKVPLRGRGRRPQGAASKVTCTVILMNVRKRRNLRISNDGMKEMKGFLREGRRAHKNS